MRYVASEIKSSTDIYTTFRPHPVTNKVPKECAYLQGCCTRIQPAILNPEMDSSNQQVGRSSNQRSRKAIYLSSKGYTCPHTPIWKLRRFVHDTTYIPHRRRPLEPGISGIITALELQDVFPKPYCIHLRPLLGHRKRLVNAFHLDIVIGLELHQSW